MEVTFRFAGPDDVELILSFVRQLADYERLGDQVVAEPEIMAHWLFEEKKAEVLFAMADGKEVAFALFFYNFSTFLGRCGIYLEDLFVLPEYRGHGVGRAVLRQLARITCQRGCGRLEWCCLDWNKPSIQFYRNLGAEPMDDWTTYRLTGDALRQMAEI